MAFSLTRLPHLHSRDLIVHVGDVYSVQEPARSIARVVMANPNLGQGPQVDGVDSEGVCLGWSRTALREMWSIHCPLPTLSSAPPS